MAEDFERSREVAALHQAALAITSERSLDKVLQKIVDAARELLQARYAALGVPGEHGKLQQFVTSGLEPDQIKAIGAFPAGKGLLGLLLGSRSPLRVANISSHPASHGFPARHPPMASFLGAPLVSHGKVIGSLYLADKIGSAEFSSADESLVEMLAAQAAVAVENARLFASSDEALHQRLEELRFERRNLKVVVEQMPEGVLIIDTLEEKVLVANRAALGLLRRENAAGQPTSDFLCQLDSAGEPMARGETMMYRVMALAQKVSGERIQLKRSDGSAFTALANASPLFDAQEKVIGGILVFQDITPQVEIDRLKDELVSIISHELRNPLTAIRGRAQLMLRVARRTPGRDEDVAGLLAIDAQVEKLADMVRELLDVSQLRLGLLELRRQPTDLVAVARLAIEQFRASDDQHVYELDAPSVPFEGEWDAIRLDQVLSNLLDNARKYSPPNTRITITVARGGDSTAKGNERKTARALVAVSDEGIGVPPQARQHLFDRFYRAANAKGRAETGLGLGLYICSEIVRQHGGSMWVDSKGGRGSTFFFDLPLDTEPI